MKQIVLAVALLIAGASVVAKCTKGKGGCCPTDGKECAALNLCDKETCGNCKK